MEAAIILIQELKISLTPEDFIKERDELLHDMFPTSEVI